MPTPERLSSHRALRGRALGIAVFSAFALGACDMNRYVATSSAGLLIAASHSIERHFDYELVGDGIPGSILQLEGVYSVIPDREDVGLQLAQAYVAYAFGWIEDHAQEAEIVGDLEAQDAALRRARLLYERAYLIARHHLRLRDSGVDAAIEAGPEALGHYLDAHYRDRADADLLLWAGQSLASAIGASNEDPELVLMLPVARVFLERSVALDESHFHASALMVLAALDSALPESFGGEPARGQQLFERALALTGRRFFTVQLTYAQTYAVGVGDRTLFVELLREVIDGGDPDETSRLANRIARRRAIRLLRRVDELFG